MHFLQISLLAVASSIRLASASDSLVERQAADSLVNALSKFSDLSSFQQIVKSNPDIISKSSSDGGSTILVPTNDALTAFAKQENVTNLSSLPVDRLQSIFQYHTLDAGLTSKNFSASKGLTVPTKLTDSLNNLRSPGPAMISQFGAQATGQVLFISPSKINPAKFRVRQSSGDSGDKANLRAGLGQDAELTGIDGQWQGGYFQAINTVLEVPGVCSTTIRKLSDQLGSLDTALKKVSLWQELDKKPNITCLGPNTEAFNSAGNPENSSNNDDLKKALLFHTLPQVTYTNFLTDGQEFMSLDNVTVRVTIKNDDIWFNDAKVVSPNVLTNNGLIHILDRVMSANGKPDDSASPSASSSSAPSGTASPSASSTPPNAGNPVAGNLRAAGVIALAAGVLLV